MQRQWNSGFDGSIFLQPHIDEFCWYNFGILNKLPLESYDSYNLYDFYVVYMVWHPNQFNITFTALAKNIRTIIIQSKLEVNIISMTYSFEFLLVESTSIRFSFIYSNLVGTMRCQNVCICSIFVFFLLNQSRNCKGEELVEIKTRRRRKNSYVFHG